MVYTLYVTGSNGFVGRNLFELAEQQQQEIKLIRSNCNLHDFDNLLKELQFIQPDCIIHLAAHVGGLYYNIDRNIQMYEDNSLMNRNLYRAANIVKTPKLISCMSTCIFPHTMSESNMSLTLDELHSGPPHPSNAGYSYAKRELDHLNQVYSSYSALTRYSLVPCNIFGPYDHFNDEVQSHVIPALISRCVDSIQAQKEFVIKGSGNALRQFVYVEDFCKILLREALSDENQTTSKIIAPDTEYTIHDVAEYIMSIVSKLLQKPRQSIRYDTTFSEGVARKHAKNDIFDFSYTSFPVALEETCSWYLNHILVLS